MELVALSWNKLHWWGLIQWRLSLNLEVWILLLRHHFRIVLLMHLIHTWGCKLELRLAIILHELSLILWLESLVVVSLELRNTHFGSNESLIHAWRAKVLINLLTAIIRDWLALCSLLRVWVIGILVRPHHIWWSLKEVILVARWSHAWLHIVINHLRRN